MGNKCFGNTEDMEDLYGGMDDLRKSFEFEPKKSLKLYDKRHFPD